MVKVSEDAQKLKDFFLEAIDKDTEAFNMIMEAFSLPKKSDEEKEIRNKKIQEGTKKATLIPFSVLEKSEEIAKLALDVAKKGNKNSLSDSGVAGLAASAASEGALYNVMINLQSIDDKEFKSKLTKKAMEINKKVQQIVNKIKEILNSELNID